MPDPGDRFVVEGRPRFWFVIDLAEPESIHGSPYRERLDAENAAMEKNAAYRRTVGRRQERTP